LGQRLLIVGVDPGTTVGYAVLDIEGNIVEINSEKELSLDKLVERIARLGKIVVIGTDKKKVPFFVDKLKAKVGARVLSPKEDMKVSDKKDLARPYSTKNSHEEDALASALFARNSVKNAIADIENIFSKKDYKADMQSIIQMHLLDPEKNIIKVLEQSNQLKPAVKEIRPIYITKAPDIAFLSEKIRKLDKDIFYLREQNSALLKQKKIMGQRYDYLKKKIRYILDSPNDSNDQKMDSLFNEMRAKNDHISLLENELNKIRSIILAHKNPIILKKLDNLGREEFIKKRDIILVHEGDILLVDDPNIISDFTVSWLKNKVNVIVHKKRLSSKNLDNLPFVFLEADKLRISEDKHFAVIEKKSFDQIKNDSNLLSKIVHDYHKERLEN